MASEFGFAHPEFLVDADWVESHLDDPNVVVVDTDVAAAYNRGHIPGAVLIGDNYQKDPDSGRVNILPPDKFAAMAESLGIGDDTRVVAYDNSKSLYAARLWWALTYYGHSDVKVLDGGWRRWVNEGHRVSLDKPKETGEVVFSAKADESGISSVDELKACYTRSDVVVWDVRSVEEYRGENDRGNSRAGHIPGSIHLEWSDLVEAASHRFKSAQEIEAALKQKGITRDKEVHSY